MERIILGVEHDMNKFRFTDKSQESLTSTHIFTNDTDTGHSWRSHKRWSIVLVYSTKVKDLFAVVVCSKLEIVGRYNDIKSYIRITTHGRR